jgi:hypothetical protein
VIETNGDVLGGVQCKYTDRALGLILVSPLAQSTSWTEWLTNQVHHRTTQYISAHDAIFASSLAVSSKDTH